MKRDVITIHDEKCNGCGLCIPNCPEGALRIIDGKVRLVSDLFCDGLGACIGHCPQDAIRIEKREAEPYDEKRVMGNIVKAGEGVVRAHLDHLRDHGQDGYLKEAVAYLKVHRITIPGYTGEETAEHGTDGCPGSRMRSLKPEQKSDGDEQEGTRPSELRQWPVQLHLLNPQAPYFKDADLAVVADCVAFAHAEFHREFLKGKTLAIFCPKLDQGLDTYVDKLAGICRTNDIRSVSVVHMEVPCCFGVEDIVRQALQRSGKEIPVKEYTISLQGEKI